LENKTKLVAGDHVAIISDKMQPENAKFCCRKSQATVAISTYGLKFEIKVNQYDDKKLKHKIKHKLTAAMLI